MGQAILANGTLFQVGDGDSPEEFTTIPEVSKLAGPAVKFDLLDVTTHDSTGGFREFIPGLADGDNINAMVNFRPSNAVHQACREDSYARTLRNFKVVFPDTGESTVDLSGYFVNINPNADMGAVLTSPMTVKVTGEPLWS
jgi:predicted secreted protein